MSCKGVRLAACCALAALAVSCSRKPAPVLQRIAILRFENLTPGAAPDWMGRAFSEVITAELTGPTGLYAIPTSRLHQLNSGMGPRPVSAPGISAEAPLALAAGANRIGYGDFAVVGGRLRARLTVEDPATDRAVAGPVEVSVDAGDVAGAATALAKAISGHTETYGTRNEAALEAYTRAIESADAGAMVSAAEQAIAADPSFGTPYALLVELRTKQQDRAGAEAVLRSATAHANAMTPMDRVRLAVADASLRGDAGAMERALDDYVKTAPLDPTAWRALAQQEAGRHRWTAAVLAYQRALEIEPGEATTWNDLGYMAAYAGNFDLARTAVDRYRQLRPAEPNPLDSMGDILLMSGRLVDAERAYLEALKKDPQFLGGADLYKAAMAHLMTGDVAGATAIAKQGSGILAGSAEWLWLTGQHKEAFAKLSTDAPRLPRDAQGRAYTQLTLWAMAQGDRDVAARMAQQAVAASTPATGAMVAVARFVAQPKASATEWSARAAQMFPNAPAGSVKDYALAYALLLDGQFGAAVPLLTEIEAKQPPTGDRSPAIELAWALVETGKWNEAAPLLRTNPVPNFGTTSVFSPLYFPRLFLLRAAVAEHDGKAAEAAENRRIYAALAGK